MNRLQKLCELHNQQGGTIHQFNALYGVDFITASLDELHNRARILANGAKSWPHPDNNMLLADKLYKLVISEQWAN